MSDPILKIPCVCLHVRRADRQLSQVYDRCLRPAGLRSTQYALLNCVAGRSDPFISDIGRVMGMDQTTVSRNIEKLEKAGLVESRTHPEDPRKKKVELSPLGRARLEAARPLWEEAQRRILTRLGSEDFQTLVALLGRLTDAAKP